MPCITRTSLIALTGVVCLSFACSEPDRQDTDRSDAGSATTDAGADAGQVPPKAPPGSACAEDTDCAGEGAVCIKSQPGGYCAIPGCSLDQTDCPANSVCVDFTGDGEVTYCIEGKCNVDNDCSREQEGFICDDDQSCWSYDYVPLNPGAAAMGSACTAPEQCESDLCLGEAEGFPGGYCTVDCDPEEPNGCPTGSTCAEDHEGYMICQPVCETADACREGYECVVGACRPSIDITLVKFGAACTGETVATACGRGGECMTNGPIETSWPNGYCVAPGCDPAVADICGAQGKCLTVNETPVCLKACTEETVATDCRVDEGYACVSGVCHRPPANDVTKVKIGAACVADADCNDDGGTGGRCLAESDGIFGTQQPGGSCVAPGCSLTDAESCGAGAKCIALAASLYSYCVAACTPATAATDCRENYICDTDSTCWAYACEAAEDCNEGQICNANGFCAPAPQ